MVAGDLYGLRPVVRVSEVGTPFPGSEGTAPVLKGARSNLLRTFWFGSQCPLSDEKEENLCKELVWGGGGGVHSQELIWMALILFLPQVMKFLTMLCLG